MVKRNHEARLQQERQIAEADKGVSPSAASSASAAVPVATAPVDAAADQQLGTLPEHPAPGDVVAESAISAPVPTTPGNVASRFVHLICCI